MMNHIDSYINRPTEELVADVDKLIRRREDLQRSARVKQAFTEFGYICQCPPAIVDFVRKKTDASNPDAGLTREQIKLFMLAMVARSSSTWGTIQAEAAMLNLVGDHGMAAIINANAMNETGDKAHRPHSLLLFDSFAVLGVALRVDPLTPARYHLVRHIHRMRQSRGNRHFSDVQAIEDHLRARRIRIRHTWADLGVALHYCDISDPSITEYHSQILRDVLRLDDWGSDAPVGRDPYDEDWKALRVLELAVREASSVDEYETGKLSYIGAWGILVDAMLGHISPDRRDEALAWTRAHNDEAVGQSVGWQGAAEEGHADDARRAALEILETLDPGAFARVLEGVTRQGDARLAFWDHVVAALEAMDRPGERIPLKTASHEGLNPAA